MIYEYKGVRYTPPSNTQGLATERPKAVSKASISDHALANLVRRGALTFVPPAHHKTIFAAGRMDTSISQPVRSQGVVNKNPPSRTSVAASSNKTFKRGDQVVHMAGHHRGVVLGPSRSKPGFLKVSIDGQVFRVSPKNLSAL